MTLDGVYTKGNLMCEMRYALLQQSDLCRVLPVFGRHRYDLKTTAPSFEDVLLLREMHDVAKGMACSSGAFYLFSL
jgi:hypothetical protein